MSLQPRISVIIPAYDSHATIRGTLTALRRQARQDFEVFVIDSGPSDVTAGMVARDFPEVHYIRSETPLRPHAARNLGAARARGEVLVFTDPDVYPVPEWLDRLTARLDPDGAALGSIACHGERWFDHGVHFAKFQHFLPAPDTEPVGSYSANLACGRRLWERFGGFPDIWTADAAIGWFLEAEGRRLQWVGDAVVHHHHLATWTDYLRERYARGADFGLLRPRHFAWSRGRLWLQIAVTASGVRLLRGLASGARDSARAGLLTRYVAALPITALGLLVWQLGEIVGCAQMLRRGRRGG